MENISAPCITKLTGLSHFIKPFLCSDGLEAVAEGAKRKEEAAFRKGKEAADLALEPDG
jgi:hypothetical protein